MPDTADLAVDPTKSILDRYYELAVDWEADKKMDDRLHHLPALLIAEYIAERITAENDKLIRAIGTLKQSLLVQGVSE